MKKLAVSETFYSIQGEGQTMGIPAVFLRLGGCNLLCQSKDWICDTIEVWKHSKATEFKSVLNDEYIKRLRQGAHLVITGGEPLLHTENLEQYLSWFEQSYKFLPVIEIETNGTIKPSDKLRSFVSYWNVSPKLSNAGVQNKKEIRINDEALQEFSSFGQKTIFKFVIRNGSDVSEISDDFMFYIKKEQIYFMPAGSSQDELKETREMVAELCRTVGVRYSDRLHISIWNLKTGV